MCIVMCILVLQFQALPIPPFPFLIYSILTSRVTDSNDLYILHEGFFDIQHILELQIRIQVGPT